MCVCVRASTIGKEAAICSVNEHTLRKGTTANKSFPCQHFWQAAAAAAAEATAPVIISPVIVGQLRPIGTHTHNCSQLASFTNQNRFRTSFSFSQITLHLCAFAPFRFIVAVVSSKRMTSTTTTNCPSPPSNDTLPKWKRDCWWLCLRLWLDHSQS